MPWYSYKEWTAWPKEDVEEYAAEVAVHYKLSDKDAESLRWKMCVRRIDISTERNNWLGPRKMDDEAAQLHVQWAFEIATFEGDGVPPSDEQARNSVWHENQRLNEPYDAPDYKFKVITAGDGLTKRQFVERIGLDWQRDAIIQKYRRPPADYPRKAFDFQRRDVEHAMHELLWKSDYLTLNDNDWFCPVGGTEPYAGLFWYYKEVLQHLRKADRKRKQRMHEEALCLAFDAGALFREMQIRAAHGEFYLKSEMTRERQTAAGKSNKLRDDELAQERWRFHFQKGLTKTEAAWQAAEDLKCSEATIRRAFGGSYPAS